MSKRNPFTPGAGRCPPCLAGREAEQHQLAAMLNDMKESGEGQTIVLYGPHGTGKTVLPGWFEGQCEQADVIAITDTPSTGLASLGDLPGLLLPKSWLPDEASLGMKGVLSAEWKKPDTGATGRLRDHLAAACRKKPRALLLDEAHTLDAAVCRSLLNLTQDVSRKAPFLLAMAGTPGLQSTLMDVGATFVERSKMMGIGLLDRQSAADAIHIPLEDGGITIADHALARVVEDAQGYPYFLQLWGQALWDCANKHGLRALGDAEVGKAGQAIAGERTDFYKRRRFGFSSRPLLLKAAYAVACAFEGNAHLHENSIRTAILNRLSDDVADPKAGWDQAVRLCEELNRRDFVWSPPGTDAFEPGIPSFMGHVKKEVERDRRQAPLEGSPSIKSRQLNEELS